MSAAAIRERRLRLGRWSGVRVRESRLTLALTALRLATCQGLVAKSRRLRGA